MTGRGASETRFDFHIAFQAAPPPQGDLRRRGLFLEMRDIALRAPFLMRPAPPAPLAGGGEALAN